MKPQGSVKLLHIISGLGQGGAETMLYKLLTEMRSEGFETQVISLLDRGVVGPRIEALGIPVISLGMRRGVPDPRALFRLARLLRGLAPDLVQTWMYHADLIGGLAARLAGVPHLVWNIRHSDLDRHRVKRSTRYTAKAGALLSGWLPEQIICCSHRAAQVHVELGYRSERIGVIPNGFDLQQFRPNPPLGREIRAELGLDERHLLFGLVARFNPQKDHHGFIQAARQTVDAFPEARFLLCGPGVEWDNPELTAWIQAADLVRQIHLLGPREDMSAINNALDVALSASASGEGFPNVLGEAMACAVPCVVTDVGDSADIVGETGLVVTPRNPGTLADAMLQMARLDPEARLARGRAARQRIETQYSIERIAAQYTALYRTLLNGPVGKGG